MVEILMTAIEVLPNLIKSPLSPVITSGSQTKVIENILVLRMGMT